MQGRAGKREGGCVHLCLCLCLPAPAHKLGFRCHFLCPQGTRAWARPLEYYVTHPITAGDGFNVVYETHPCEPGAQQGRIGACTVQPVTEAAYTCVRQRVCCPTPPNPPRPAATLPASRAAADSALPDTNTLVPHADNPSADFAALWVNPSKKLPVLIGEFGPVDGYMTSADAEALMQVRLRVGRAVVWFVARFQPSSLRTCSPPCSRVS